VQGFFRAKSVSHGPENQGAVRMLPRRAREVQVAPSRAVAAGQGAHLGLDGGKIVRQRHVVLGTVEQVG
jgi:hypothetical protein